MAQVPNFDKLKWTSSLETLITGGSLVLIHVHICLPLVDKRAGPGFLSLALFLVSRTIASRQQELHKGLINDSK